MTKRAEPPAKTKTETETTNASQTIPPEPSKSGHSDDDREEEAATARVAVSRAAWELSDTNIISLGNFLAVMEANEGSRITPVEDYIVELPWRWKLCMKYGAMTPDDLIEKIDGPDGIRQDWDDAVAIARSFPAKYAELLANPEKPSEAEGDC